MGDEETPRGHRFHIPLDARAGVGHDSLAPCGVSDGAQRIRVHTVREAHSHEHVRFRCCPEHDEPASRTVRSLLVFATLKVVRNLRRAHWRNSQTAVERLCRVAKSTRVALTRGALRSVYSPI